jgi:hypothetical protein
MRKANILKGIMAILLILVVVVVTVNYGKSQRSRISLKDATKSTLPTVQDSSASNKENNNSSQSQPAQAEQPKTEPAPVVSAPVQAQNTHGQMPATGPADTVLPVLALGTMSGLYLASRRKLKQLG